MTKEESKLNLILEPILSINMLHLLSTRVHLKNNKVIISLETNNTLLVEKPLKKVMLVKNSGSNARQIWILILARYILTSCVDLGHSDVTSGKLYGLFKSLFHNPRKVVTIIK